MNGTERRGERHPNIITSSYRRTGERVVNDDDLSQEPGSVGEQNNGKERTTTRKGRTTTVIQYNISEGGPEESEMESGGMGV